MQTKELLAGLKNHEFDERLKALYVDEAVLEHQRARYIAVIEKYVELYGDGEVEIYSAPGRSEVGGNHTDHQHGRVLATSINLDAIGVVGKVQDTIKPTITLIGDSTVYLEYKEKFRDDRQVDSNRLSTVYLYKRFPWRWQENVGQVYRR